MVAWHSLVLGVDIDKSILVVLTILPVLNCPREWRNYEGKFLYCLLRNSLIAGPPYNYKTANFVLVVLHNYAQSRFDVLKRYCTKLFSTWIDDIQVSHEIAPTLKRTEYSACQMLPTHCTCDWTYHQPVNRGLWKAGDRWFVQKGGCY